MRILGVIAMREEADAVVDSSYSSRRLGPYELHDTRRHDCDLSIVVSGVGPAASASATASVLAVDEPFDLVLSVGIAGGFPGKGVDVGDLVVATEVVPADLGIKIDDNWIDPVSLDWLSGVLTPARWFIEAAASFGAEKGPVLTVSTVAGAEADAALLSYRHPEAVAVAMEGVGVALAAERWGVSFAELRVISDMAGRLVETLDLSSSLDRLSSSFPAVLAELAAGRAR